MAPVEHENYIFAGQRRQSERFAAGLGQGEIRRGLAGLYAIQVGRWKVLPVRGAILSPKVWNRQSRNDDGRHTERIDSVYELCSSESSTVESLPGRHKLRTRETKLAIRSDPRFPGSGTQSSAVILFAFSSPPWHNG